MAVQLAMVQLEGQTCMRVIGKTMGVNFANMSQIKAGQLILRYKSLGYCYSPGNMQLIDILTPWPGISSYAYMTTWIDPGL